MKTLVRIILAGIGAMVFDVVIAGLTCGWLFNWVYTLEPTNVWRPLQAPPMWFYAVSLVLTILMAAMYAMICKGVPGKNRLVRGLLFGLLVWIVGTLPGMLATFAFMTVATTVVVYWTITGLVILPIKGLIIAVIYGK
ncbi:MAG: hypothetical protein JXA11_03920 [Phycisphaerae bacterium]|nr:hypothetical protein [Phycisphaerae bacterium]